ncbi:MAG: TIGR04255 family protein, partial [Leptolyngbyaceae cyanobacterium CAN_BIN12]|nr:TIGR04255 family protein [Leptolyngbyaceae cyanobacterium CAN_BIN12]
MGEKLKSQPLVEALCEFQFNLAGSNELTLPGLFYAQVREEFPHQDSVNELNFQVGLNNVGTIPQFISAQRLQLKRPDGSAMLQIGQGRLIVNRLQPYINWEDFRELIS